MQIPGLTTTHHAPRSSLRGMLGRLCCVGAVLVLAALPGLAQEAVPTDEAAAASDAQDAVLARAWVIGPFPAGVPVPADVLPRGEQVLVPEIEPDRALPDPEQRLNLAAGDVLRWRETAAGDDGVFLPEDAGTYWLAARLYLARSAEVAFAVDPGTALYCNGEDVTTLGPAATAEALSATRSLSRGWTTLYIRATAGARITATAPIAAQPRWSLAEQVPLTRFGDIDALASAGALAVSDGGDRVARRLYRRSDDHQSVDVFTGDGDLLAVDLGGPEARPVMFLPGDTGLLLSRSGDDGTDLLLWPGPGQPLRLVLDDEPGLGLIRSDRSGRWLLLSSTRGFSASDPVDGPGRRWTRLRERVTDYDPQPHLHLLDLAGGARRVLTRPGDFVLDDAVFTPDGQAVIYGRSLPMEPRPWFHSEIRRLDLQTGADELIAEFTAGWEVRPQSFALDRSGRRLAFIGPPEEIGPGHAEHNVYNKQVWLLDLADGHTERLTGAETYTYDGGAGLPVFDDKGRLLVRVNDRSRNVLGRLAVDGDGAWRTEVLPHRGQNLRALAVSPAADAMVYTASTDIQPSALYAGRPGRKGDLLEAYNTDFDAGHLWSEPETVICTGGDGEDLDAWLYRPLVMSADGEAAFGATTAPSPLIVYYYGGATPTLHGFNPTHQFFAANGYAVLVVNPRGAHGFGAAFADCHAGDWGPKAGDDIIAATRQVLGDHPWLDGDHIGIYGGSYGGFMTEYLVTRTDLFAAAVSMYGISDLASYWGQGAWGWTYGDMALGGATPWGDPDQFVSKSPLFNADRINTPLLLLHGLADTNVTPGESIQLFTALSVLDKPVEMVLFDGEGHGISGDWDNRVGHRTMILEWFDRFLRDQPEAWNDRWE